MRIAIDTKLPYIDPSHHPKPFALRPRIDAALAKASTVDVLHCREWKVAAVSGPQNSAAPFKPAKGSGLPSDVVLHTAATEEWIWQFAGSVTVRLLDGNALRSVEVGPGQIFLVPAGIPHSYERKSSESCGVVVTLERAASNGVKDSIGIFDITNLTSAPRPVNATDPGTTPQPQWRCLVARSNALHVV